MLFDMDNSDGKASLKQQKSPETTTDTRGMSKFLLILHVKYSYFEIFIFFSRRELGLPVDTVITSQLPLLGTNCRSYHPLIAATIICWLVAHGTTTNMMAVEPSDAEIKSALAGIQSYLRKRKLMSKNLHSHNN